MAILPPIAPIAAGATPVGPTTRMPGLGATEGAGSTGTASEFGNVLTGALDNLENSQRITDEMTKASASGDVQRVEDLMIASTETQLTTQLTVATRNRAIESFNEIMRMQL